MDIEKLMKAFAAQISQEASEGVMTLGELIARLEGLPQESEARLEFYDAPADEFGSYRGYYEMLAIEPGRHGHRTVAQVLTDARAALGKTFEGYKGGDYVMTRSTPVWVSDYGTSSGQALQSIEMRDGVAVFVSAAQD